MTGDSRLTVMAGSLSLSVWICARDVSTGAVRVNGLRHDDPGTMAAYVRAGERSVRSIPVVEGSVGAHVPGGLIEVDPHLLPGVYRFGLPDEMIRRGSVRAALQVHLPGALVAPVAVALVRYDPREPERIRMRCLQWDQRWQFLRQGLPRLTEMELALSNDGPHDKE